MDTQTYIDPGFVAKKTILDWNGWKVTASSKEIISLLASILPAVLYTGVLMSYSWKIGLLIILSSIPIIYASVRFGKRVWAIWDDNSSEKIVWSLYRNALWGDITELKVMGAGKYIVNKMLSLHRKFLAKISSNELNRLLALIGTTVIEYGLLIAAYVILLQGIIDQTYTVGAFVVITASLWGVKRELGNTFECVSVLETNANFIDDFIAYMDWKPVICSIPHAIKLEKAVPVSIEFRNVWFKYPRAKQWVFRDVSFTITKDEDVAIVGKNGAGKSTLVKLITRMYDPTKGEILISGVPLTQIDLEDFYKTIGLLNQDFRIYEFTAKENILLGDVSKKPAMTSIAKYAKLAQAHDFISKLKNEYATYLTNNVPEGQPLSGGQLQRLAIARVFYRKPKLLIMDEPTSAIDAIAEEEIFDNIFEYSENRTVIIISHRFATVKKAKRILVIDEGKIVETGTHEQLLSNNGLYKQMYTAQNDSD